MKFKYAAFDMDGTLLDTMQYWQNIFTFYAEMHGLPKPNIAEADAIASIHMPYRERISFLRERYDDDALKRIELKDIFDVIEYCYGKYPCVKPGVIEMLNTLRDNGVKMCIASATPTRLVDFALKRNGIREYFDFILTPDEYPDGKFTPDIFSGIAERFGCDVKEITLFEDTLYSIKTAASIGMPTVAIYDKYCTDTPDTVKAAATVYIESFEDFKYE